MSERNRYVVDVTYTAVVWADDRNEAEQYAIEEIEAGQWHVGTVDVYEKPAPKPYDQEPQPHE